jgi:hypothetical protein
MNSAGLKKGSFVVSCTKRLPNPDFVVVDQTMYQMSWGTSTIFISQKTTDAELLPFEAS